jgi:hypothetical protein
VDNECRKVWGDLGIGFTSGRWLILCRVAAYLNHGLQRIARTCAPETGRCVHKDMMKLILLSCILLVCSCALEYKDISHQLGPSQLLGTQYVLLKDMLISGINLPPGYGREIDVYKISSVNPTWTGPELISRHTLPKGTKFVIARIKKCTNCLKRTVVATVEISDYSKKVLAPIEFDLKYLRQKYVERLK